MEDNLGKDFYCQIKRWNTKQVNIKSKGNLKRTDNIYLGYLFYFISLIFYILKNLIPF